MDDLHASVITEKISRHKRGLQPKESLTIKSMIGSRDGSRLKTDIRNPKEIRMTKRKESEKREQRCVLRRHKKIFAKLRELKL